MCDEKALIVSTVQGHSQHGIAKMESLLAREAIISQKTAKDEGTIWYALFELLNVVDR